jgi:hypothetical protein
VRRILVCLAIGALLLSACASEDGADTRADPAPDKYDEAVADASAWFEATGGIYDQTATIILDYLGRRFGLTVEQVARAGLLEVADTPAAESFRPYLRLLDPAYQANAAMIAAEDDEINVLTLPALHCDRVPLDPGHMTTLESALGQGEYEATHAVLAYEWLDELNCIPEDEVEARKAAAVGPLLAVAEQAGLDTDLGIEAAVMLHYAGHGDAVPAGWVQEVLDAQNPDGGWSPRPGEGSGAHTTSLAMWFLLASAAGGDDAVPWIPDAPAGD